ncbi:MAG TPA: helix-turn-helix domain-containing protein [Dokdonella sp.]
MKEEREAFAARLADAMREAGYEPRPAALFKLFNSHYHGRSVSFQSVSRWLNGRSIPAQDKLRVLAKLLGVEPQRLRFGDAPRGVAEPRGAWAIGLKPLDRETIEAYLALPASQRRLVRELIAALRR